MTDADASAAAAADTAAAAETPVRRRRAKAVVQITLTTWDDRLCRILEPNVCPTSALYPAVPVVENGKVTGWWKVAARDRRLTL